MLRRLLSVIAAWGAAALGAASASAALPSGCAQSATAPTVTCTFAGKIGEQTFVVPAGVTSVSVTAVGSPGAGNDGVPGGAGAIASATLAVAPGQTLYVEAAPDSQSSGVGWNGAGASDGGSQSAWFGGGASDVQTVSCGFLCPESGQAQASRLIVAGGGGAAGGPGSSGATGGAGGAAGSAGATGVADAVGGGGGGGGGGPGSSSAGGAGGSGGAPGPTDTGVGANGGAGSGAQGGEMVSGNGGGGGGGWFGGGAGGDGAAKTAGGTPAAGGGGGGGGSSYVPAGGTVGVAPPGTAPSVTISYAAAPISTSAPAISGTAKSGMSLTCLPGGWTGGPSFAYSWSRDGTPLIGATGASYRVQELDEGSTLACTVTASNGAGAAAALTSASVKVAVPKVPRCPAASGRLSGTRLARIRLGMTLAQVKQAYTHSSSRGRSYEDFFCLEPRGIRVGVASPKLLRTLRAAPRRHYSGRVVWISTANPTYTIRGIRNGSTQTAAVRALPHGHLFRIGANDWYLAKAGSATAVLKIRRGQVEEIGIAIRALSSTVAQQRTLMGSFS